MRLINRFLLVRKFFFFLFLVPFVPLIAQDSLSFDQLEWRDLMNIQVTSAGKKAQNVKDAPANIIVVTKAQIEERGYLTLQEVFRDLPGYDFAVGTPSGEYPTHFLFRGIGDVGQTKYALYLDGVLQNDISNGWFRHIGYNFSLSNIERIEVVSGPGSALFGSNAVAGFVNIITKQGYKNKNKRYEAVSNSFVGNNNTYHQDFNGWVRLKNKTSVSFTGRYFQSDGDNGIGRFDPGNYFQNNFEPDSVKLRSGSLVLNEKTESGLPLPLNSGFKTSVNDYYFRSKINYKNFDISASHWEKTEGLGSYVVGYEYFTNDDEKDYLANHSGRSFQMKYTFSPSDIISSMSRTYFLSQKVKPETGFSYTYQSQDINTSDTIVPNYKKTYESEGYLIGLEEQLNFKFNLKHHLIWGFQFEQKIREFFNINYFTKEDSSNLSLINQSIELRPVFFSANGASFVQDEYWLSDKLVLTSGLRFDVDEFYGAIFNPRAALVFSQQHGLNFKALFGQGYKPPTIFELYDEWRGHFDLEPEIIQTCEVELSYLKAKWDVTLNAFYNDLKNMIVVAENPDAIRYPIGENGQKEEFFQNIGSINMLGISLRSNWHPSKNWLINWNYQTISNGAFESIDNTARHRFNFVINYRGFKYLNLNLRGNWSGKIKAPSTNLYFQQKTTGSIESVGYDYVTEQQPDGYLDGHFLLHLTLTGKNINVGKNLIVEPFLKIDNLLNEQYAYMGRQSGSGIRPVSSIQTSITNPNGFIPAYHPQAGRVILGGLRLKFN